MRLFVGLQPLFSNDSVHKHVHPSIVQFSNRSIQQNLASICELHIWWWMLAGPFPQRWHEHTHLPQKCGANCPWAKVPLHSGDSSSHWFTCLCFLLWTDTENSAYGNMVTRNFRFTGFVFRCLTSVNVFIPETFGVISAVISQLITSIQISPSKHNFFLSFWWLNGNAEVEKTQESESRRHPLHSENIIFHHKYVLLTTRP